MHKFSKKDIKADLKEYSNQVTKRVNDYIVSHPNVMHEVILAANSLKNEDELYFWMQETLERNTPDIRRVWLDAPGNDIVNWKELAYAWFNTVKRDEALPGEFSIEQLPILDKKKKLDELLDQLSKEIDPTKKEQIKQHITRIKNAKLLRADELGEPISTYDPGRGQQEISKYSPEYQWLMKLITTVVKAGVPPVEIKQLAESFPFVTVDDIGDLAAKIWTLATEKYNIPREWLIKKLPEKKVQGDLRDEKWPAQRNTTYFGMRPWNETAYESWKNTEASEEKQASPETDHALAISIGEDVIQEYFFQKGIRWSQVVQFIRDQAPQLTDEDIVNLKTDTKYKLEQFKIQIDSKKKGLSLDKVLQILEQKGFKPVHVDYKSKIIEFMDKSKLSFDEATRKALDLSKYSSAESEEQERNSDAGHSFYDSPTDLGKQRDGQWPSDTWMPSGQADKDAEPWDNIAASKKISKKELKKKADVSGKVVNDILYLIEQTGGVTYNLQKGNLINTPMFAVSTHKDKEQIVDSVDFDVIEGYIINNQDLLNDPNNSFAAWKHGNKIYLDIVNTVPTKEEALQLANANNQSSIFNLQTMEEITVGLPAFSKKELNIVKNAEEQLLTQDQQDQIAASTGSPTYNIALNNFASAVKKGHDKDRSLAYAVDSVKNLEKIDPKKLVELANTYLKGLL
jgi:hypothetical protein